MDNKPAKIIVPEKDPKPWRTLFLELARENGYKIPKDERRKA